jgi:hypothetical protein
VRDEDIDFIVPNKVKDDFWNKANKQGFMYMPKWDPVLAKYYHPKTDRAGNNPVDTSDIEPNKGEWKRVGGNAVEKKADSRPAPKAQKDQDEERHSSSRDSRPESVKPKQKPLPMAAPVTKQPSSKSSSSGGSGGSGSSSGSGSSPVPQRGSSPSASAPRKSESVTKGKATMPRTQSRANPGQTLPGHMVPSVRSDAPQMPEYDFYGNIIPTSGSISSGNGNSGSASYSNGGGSSYYDAHSGPQWHYSFGKVYPKADQKAGMTSIVMQRLSTQKPANSKAQPTNAVVADTQADEQQQGQGQPVYWAYDQAGKLVPVYAGLNSAEASIAASGTALQNIADSYTAVDDSTAMTEAEAAALYNNESYELADDYEQVPVAIAAADGTAAAAADGAVADADAADADADYADAGADTADADAGTADADAESASADAITADAGADYADADSADAEPAAATVSVASVDAKPAATSSSTAATAADAAPAAEDVVVISAIEVGYRQE